MFRFLANLFRPPTKPDPFFDDRFGEFQFANDLGWQTMARFGDSNAELVLGSDGENPSEEMLAAGKAWIDDWDDEFPRLIEFIRNEIETWTFEPDPPIAENLTIDSLNILWPNLPNICMIYFTDPNDDIRHYHLTLDGRTPNGFAYDD